jgi:hypothetical protein
MNRHWSDLTRADYFELRISGKSDVHIHQVYRFPSYSRLIKMKNDWGFAGCGYKEFAEMKKRIKDGQKHFKGRRYV